MFNEIELQTAMQTLKPLLGEWVGEGVVQFPTMPSVAYHEELSFTQVEERPIIQYEQRTFKRQGESFVPSHWENGFLRPISDTNIELVSAQSGGRVEVLTGNMTVAGAELRLDLTSKNIGNDERMIATARTWVVQGDTLKYLMSMSTNHVFSLNNHIEANLVRVKSGR